MNNRSNTTSVTSTAMSLHNKDSGYYAGCYVYCGPVQQQRVEQQRFSSVYLVSQICLAHCAWFRRHLLLGLLVKVSSSRYFAHVMCKLKRDQDCSPSRWFVPMARDPKPDISHAVKSSFQKPLHFIATFEMVRLLWRDLRTAWLSEYITSAV